MSAPYKMKGFSYPGLSPMKGKSKTNKEGRETVEQYASGEKEVVLKGDKRSSAELTSLSERARKDGNIKAADLMLAKANKKKEEQGRAQDYLNKTS